MRVIVSFTRRESCFPISWRRNVYSCCPLQIVVYLHESMQVKHVWVVQPWAVRVSAGIAGIALFLLLDNLDNAAPSAPAQPIVTTPVLDTLASVRFIVHECAHSCSVIEKITPDLSSLFRQIHAVKATNKQVFFNLNAWLLFQLRVIPRCCQANAWGLQCTQNPPRHASNRSVRIIDRL